MEYLKMIGVALATVLDNQQQEKATLARIERLLAQQQPDDVAINAAVDRLIEDALAR